MKRDRATYMREYRARKKPMQRLAKASVEVMTDQAKRIAELEAEVAHLKRELATRAKINPPQQRPAVWIEEDRFNTRPFTPVPKNR